MIVTIESVSNISTRLNVSVPTSEVNKQFEARLKRTAKTIKINGFRPGKVPLNVVRRDYGTSIYQDVVNDVVRDSVFEAIQQEKVNAVSMPNIEKVEVKDDALVFEAVVEVYPNVTVNSFDTLTIERKQATIEDQDVDVMLENLQKQRQVWKESDTAAQNGSKATFDFEGSVDGEKFEGGTAEDFVLVLGSGRMIPGFEDGIVGMKAGEEKVIDVTFPADYQAEHLAGKAAQFKITLKQVEEAEVPEINADFLKNFGVSEEEGVEKLKADIRKNMEREVRNGLRNQVKAATFDALVAANEIEVPNAMIAQEIERKRQQMIQQFVQQFGEQAAKAFDAKLLPDDMFKEDAEKAVKLGVLVGKIIDTAGLTVDQERVAAFIEDMSSSYEDPEEVKEFFTKDQQQRGQIEAVVLEDQVVDYILQTANVTEKTVSYQDLLQEQQARQAM